MGEEIKDYLRLQLAEGKSESFLRDSLKEANIPETVLDEILLEQKNKINTPFKIIPPKPTFSKTTVLTDDYLEKHSKKASRVELTKNQKIIYVLLGIVLNFIFSLILIFGKSISLEFGNLAGLFINIISSVIIFIGAIGFFAFRKKSFYQYLALGLILFYVIILILLVILMIFGLFLKN